LVSILSIGFLLGLRLRIGRRCYASCLSVIFSENRYTLFGIML
jgi:hypothetical protein